MISNKSAPVPETNPQPTSDQIDRALISRWRETSDQEALDALVEKYMPLIIDRSGRWGSLADGPGNATIVFLEAVETFDPERGTPFAGWAARCMAQHLPNRIAADHGVGKLKKAGVFAVRRLASDFEARGIEHTEAIEKAVALAGPRAARDIDRKLAFIESAFHPTSLDGPSETDALAYVANCDVEQIAGATGEDATIESIDDARQLEEFRDALAHVRASAAPSEAAILDRRLLAPEGAEQGQAELAVEFGVSRYTVGRREASILDRLRDAMLVLVDEVDADRIARRNQRLALRSKRTRLVTKPWISDRVVPLRRKTPAPVVAPVVAPTTDGKLSTPPAAPPTAREVNSQQTNAGAHHVEQPSQVTHSESQRQPHRLPQGSRPDRLLALPRVPTTLRAAGGGRPPFARHRPGRIAHRRRNRETATDRRRAPSTCGGRARERGNARGALRPLTIRPLVTHRSTGRIVSSTPTISTMARAAAPPCGYINHRRMTSIRKGVFRDERAEAADRTRILGGA